MFYFWKLYRAKLLIISLLKILYGYIKRKKKCFVLTIENHTFET